VCWLASFRPEDTLEIYKHHLEMVIGATSHHGMVGLKLDLNRSEPKIQKQYQKTRPPRLKNTHK
jgi:hypothetical protein